MHSLIIEWLEGSPKIYSSPSDLVRRSVLHVYYPYLKVDLRTLLFEVRMSSAILSVHSPLVRASRPCSTPPGIDELRLFGLGKCIKGRCMLNEREIRADPISIEARGEGCGISAEMSDLYVTFRQLFLA